MRLRANVQARSDDPRLRGLRAGLACLRLRLPLAALRTNSVWRPALPPQGIGVLAPGHIRINALDLELTAEVVNRVHSAPLYLVNRQSGHFLQF